LKPAWEREKGSAELFEAALVLSMLLTLVLGTIYIARAFSNYQTLTRVVQDAARVAALQDTPPGSCPTWASGTDLPTAIQGELKAAGINPTSATYPMTVSVSCDALTNAAGTSLSEPEAHVTFTYGFPVVIPFTPRNYTTLTIKVGSSEKIEY
jgi:hypothetical protein